MKRRALTALTRRFSVVNRHRKLQLITSMLRSTQARSVIVVGASGRGAGYENIIERGLAESFQDVVISGIQLPSERWERYVVCDGLALPFRTNAVDAVISNAVIEHVGDRPEQVTFVGEHERVGRSWIVTTPNRLFPIESHTRQILRHYSPKWRSAQTVFTRLLTRAEFRDLLPPGVPVHGWTMSPTFMAAKLHKAGQQTRR